MRTEKDRAEWEWGLVDHVLAALDCAFEAVEEEDAPDTNGDVLFSLGQAIWHHVEHARGALHGRGDQ